MVYGGKSCVFRIAAKNTKREGICELACSSWRNRIVPFWPALQAGKPSVSIR